MRGPLLLWCALAAVLTLACAGAAPVVLEPGPPLAAPPGEPAAAPLPRQRDAPPEVTANSPAPPPATAPTLGVTLRLAASAERAPLTALIEDSGTLRLADGDAAVVVSDNALPESLPVLLGAWAAVVHQRHDVLAISGRDLRRALTGVVGDWRSLGGAPAQIQVVVPISDHPALLQALAMERLASGARLLSLAGVVDFVRATPGALALVPIAALEPGVLPLVLDGHDPLRDPAVTSPLRRQRWLAGDRAGIAAVLEALAWTPLPPLNPVGLLATGDYIPVRCTGQAVRRFADGDYHAIFERVGDHLRAADLTVVSMEVAATARIEITPCEDVMRQLILTAPPQAVDALAGAGVDVVTTAGNHAGDCHGGCPWPDAIRDTIDRLDSNDLAHAGTGADLDAARAPAVWERDGIRVAFLAYDQIAPWYWATADEAGTAPFDLATLAADIAAARAQANHVVVAFSWGTEYTPRVTGIQEEAIRIAREAGATLVIGNHPHALQPLVAAGDFLAAYALGNFVFDQDWSIGTTESVILEVGLAADRILGYRVRPVVIRQNFQPELVDPAGTEGQTILARLWAATDELRERTAPAPAAGFAAEDLARLSPAAAEAVAAAPGAVGVAVVDLVTGTLYGHAVNRPFRLASVAKLPLAWATLAADPSDQQRDKVDRAITWSDNASAEQLWADIGAEAVVAAWDAAGAAGIEVNVAHWAATEAPAAAVAVLLLSLLEEEAAPPEVREPLLDLLTGVIPAQHWGISAGLAPGWDALLKNGWVERDGAWLIHSAGIVRDPDGTPRAVVVILTWAVHAFPDGVALVESIAAPINRALTEAVGGSARIGRARESASDDSVGAQHARLIRRHHDARSSAPVTARPAS